MFSDSTPSHQQSLSVLRDNQQFAQHIVSVAVLKVHQVDGTWNECNMLSLNYQNRVIFRSKTVVPVMVRLLCIHL